MTTRAGGFPKTAIILAGGAGRRLKPVSGRTPKSLMPFLGRPFIARRLEFLKKSGVREAVICAGPRERAFRAALGGGQAFGLRIFYAREPKPMGTGGALWAARKFLPRTGPVLVLNGDIAAHPNLRAFLRLHRARGAAATLMLARVQDASPFGLARTGADGRILDFLEKPARRGPGWINAGIYWLEPEALRLIPRGRPCSLERDIFPRLAAQNRLYGWKSCGSWFDVGAPERFRQAERAGF
ncbi:MAG: nucleotidyltransferase family protein [Elusimicrobia bacterium]|nr:nucleotidyltransferase family protein [Elusimicrobiota bacterium]